MAIKLVIFGFFGTTVNVPWIDKRTLHLLPGRKEKAQELINGGKMVGLVAQQGGVAFGFHSEQEGLADVKGVADELGTSLFSVGFGHPNPKYGYELYANPHHLYRRFPSPGLLLDVCGQAKVQPSEALLVTQQDDELAAARTIGMPTALAVDYFASPEDLAGKVYALFRLLVPLLPLNEQAYVNLVLSPDGRGQVTWPDTHIGYAAKWSSLSEAVRELQSAIDAYTQENDDPMSDDDDDLEPGVTEALTLQLDDLP